MELDSKVCNESKKENFVNKSGSCRFLESDQLTTGIGIGAAHWTSHFIIVLECVQVYSAQHYSTWETSKSPRSTIQ
jgi:hypothetical protein